MSLMLGRPLLTLRVARKKRKKGGAKKTRKSVSAGRADPYGEAVCEAQQRRMAARQAHALRVARHQERSVVFGNAQAQETKGEDNGDDEEQEGEEEEEEEDSEKDDQADDQAGGAPANTLGGFAPAPLPPGMQAAQAGWHLNPMAGVAAALEGSGLQVLGAVNINMAGIPEMAGAMGAGPPPVSVTVRASTGVGMER